MNRNTAVVLAIIVAGIILGTVYVVNSNRDQMSMVIQFNDKDGNLIDVPMAITAGGVEVKEMKVTASWTITGTDIEPSTFNVAVAFKIDLKDLDGIWRMLDTRTADSSVMVGSHAETWTLTELLAEYMTEAYKAADWELRIYATLVATATDTSGNTVEPVMMNTPTITATLTWFVPIGALCIIDCDVTRVLVIA